MKKGSKLYSIWHHKCPNCQEEKLFKSSAYSKTFIQMHESCANCGLKYEREPSFFYGAMYVNYGFTVAIAVAWMVINALFLHWEILHLLIGLGASLLILMPVLFRISRVTWLNLFVGYKKYPFKTKN